MADRLFGYGEIGRLPLAIVRGSPFFLFLILKFNKMIKIDNFSFYNADCLKIMKTFSDKQFDLAIVDPPYGIGISSNPVRQQHEKKQWDNEIPSQEYFNELFRVSKSQIIWGGNYFPLPPTQCFYIWDKKQPHNFSLAMCEMAWTSFSKPAKIWNLSVLKEKNKIHPTQKPIEIYDWLIKNNTENGYSILDTHLGSASIALAVDKVNKFDNMNLSLTGIELDSDYFNAAIKRFRNNRVSEVLPFYLDCP